MFCVYFDPFVNFEVYDIYTLRWLWLNFLDVGFGNSFTAPGSCDPGGRLAGTRVGPLRFIKCLFYFFPYSFFSASLLPLFNCLISFLLFPCESVGRLSTSSTFSIAMLNVT